jgi:hypothetical protein
VKTSGEFWDCLVLHLQHLFNYTTTSAIMKYLSYRSSWLLFGNMVVTTDASSMRSGFRSLQKDENDNPSFDGDVQAIIDLAKRRAARYPSGTLEYIQNLFNNKDTPAIAFKTSASDRGTDSGNPTWTQSGKEDDPPAMTSETGTLNETSSSKNFTKSGGGTMSSFQGRPSFYVVNGQKIPVQKVGDISSSTPSPTKAESPPSASPVAVKQTSVPSVAPTAMEKLTSSTNGVTNNDSQVPEKSATGTVFRPSISGESSFPDFCQ